MRELPVGLMDVCRAKVHNCRTHGDRLRLHAVLRLACAARNSGGSSRRGAFEEEIMWQLHAIFRLGGYRTPELDMTPVLAVTLIVAVVGLIIRTGL